MPDLSAIRRRARLLHGRLTALYRLTDPVPDAHRLILAAVEDQGYASHPLKREDPLLYHADAVLDRDYKKIWYCAEIPPATMRYALAHEIAHLYLHAGHTDPGFLEGENRNPLLEALAPPPAVQVLTGYSPAEQREAEANLFAAELLLPYPVLYVAFVHRGLRAADIAERVGLSEELVYSQLCQCLLLPNGGNLRPDRPTRQEAPLDDEQRAAATVPSGPVIVDAGPGTGKTRTLTERVQYLIRERGANPERILVLTFSNRASEEMRARLQTALREQADALRLGTFHAFGREILCCDGADLGFSGTPAILDRPAQIALLQANAADLPNPYRTDVLDPNRVTKLLSKIGSDKDALLDPDSVAAQARVIDAESRAGTPNYSAMYGAYQNLMRAHNCVDFGDLLMLPVHLLERHDQIRSRWQHRFDYILVDEYQDVNRASIRLLQLVAGEPAAGLWAVGDARQSIYAFRGAGAENVEQFAKDFAGGRTLSLKRNYRSSSGLVKLFGRSAAQISRAFSDWTAYRSGEPDKSAGLPLIVAEATDAASLVAGIARHVGASSVPLADQAVLCRHNSMAATIATNLAALGVPTLYLGALLKREEVQDLLALLHYTTTGADFDLARIAGFPCYRGTEGKKRRDEDLAALTDERDPWRLLCRYLFDCSEYLHYLLRSESVESKLQLAALFRFIQLAQSPQNDLLGVGASPDKAQFLEKIERMIEWNADAPTGEQVGLESIDAVRVMTIHQAKGLEFGVVYLPTEERRAGRRRSSETANQEANVTFVALTRARDQAVLCGTPAALQETYERFTCLFAPANEKDNGAATWVDWGATRSDAVN